MSKQSTSFFGALWWLCEGVTADILFFIQLEFVGLYNDIWVITSGRMDRFGGKNKAIRITVRCGKLGGEKLAIEAAILVVVRMVNKVSTRLL